MTEPPADVEVMAPLDAYVQGFTDGKAAAEFENQLRLRSTARETADWLSITQAVYHAVAQNFGNDTRATCQAGMCGDFREYRDKLYEALGETTNGK